MTAITEANDSGNSIQSLMDLKMGKQADLFKYINYVFSKSFKKCLECLFDYVARL